ncbi:MAG: O-antigen ligase family protein [Lentisphaeria bacterium]|nr:O-antigen ligase family protein [Lentisphaeria bacterium]
MLRKQREAGMEISNIMEIRIRDGRIFSTLGSCNTFAGFLLLTIPVVLILLWRCGRYVEPVKISQLLFTGTGILLLAVPLLMTRSRGAWLCAASSAFLWFICCKRVKKTYKIITALCCIAVLIAGVFAVCRSGRGILSAVERLDYCRSALIMCCEHPVAGSGWGEFFHRHMKLKLSSSDESARSPHNLPLQFACHSGIPAGIIALAAVVLLLVELFRSKSGDPLLTAGRWGILAFMLHCFMEINDVIPASMVCCALTAMALLPHNETPDERSLLSRTVSVSAALLLAAGAFASNFRWLQGEAAFEQFEIALRPKMDQERVTAPDPYTVMQRLKQMEYFRPRSPYPFEMAGDLFFRTGDLENAAVLFEKSRSLVPGRPAVYRRLAAVAFCRGDREKSAMYLRKAREIFPADPKNSEKAFFDIMNNRR